MELTDNQQIKLQKLYSRLYERELEQLANNSSFQNMDNANRYKYMQEARYKTIAVAKKAFVEYYRNNK